MDSIICASEIIIMGEDAKKTYRLYAMPLTQSNIATAAAERFSRATPNPEPGYVLVYTNGEKPKQAEEITEGRTNLLSPADMRWLFDSNAAIIAEEMERNKPEILRGMSEKIEALEAELKRRKKELETKGE